MQINFYWDNSVLSMADSQRALFEGAVQAAGTVLDNLIQNDITVTIAVGYGEAGGYGSNTPLAIDPNPNPKTNGITLAEGSDLYAQVTYTGYLQALQAATTPAPDAAAIAALPAEQPSVFPSDDNVGVAPAQEKALGLTAPDDSAGEIDGDVGVSASTLFTFDYDTTGAAVPTGETSLVGVMEHELTHDLGRYADDQNQSVAFSSLDLFRYASPGTLTLADGQPDYFSLDGGTNDINNFDTISDTSDWSGTQNGTTSVDSFDAFEASGSLLPLGLSDLLVLGALGYDVAYNPPADINWIGSSNGDFNHAGNWDEQLVPSATNDVAIPLNVNITLDDQSTNTAVDSLHISAGSDLSITSGYLTVSDANAISGNYGVIAIEGAGYQAALWLAGTFGNDSAGVIDIVGPGAVLQTNSSTLDLAGGGKVEMTLGDIGGRTFSDATPFDTLVSDNTIEGSGTIGRSGFLNTLTFDNNGTVLANDVSGLSINAPVVNTGLLSATGVGSLTLDGPITNIGGTIQAGNGGIVQFDTTDVTGGTIVGSGGTLEVVGNTTLDSSTSPIELTGTIVVEPTGVLTLTKAPSGGVIDARQGYLQLAGGLLPKGSHVLTAPGHVHLLAGGNVILASTILPNGLTIGDGQEEVFSGYGVIETDDTLALNGAAVLAIDEDIQLTGTGPVVLGGPNAAIVALGLGDGYGTDELDNYTTIFGQGLLGGGSLAMANEGTILAQGGTLTVDTGTLGMQDGGLIGAADGADLVLLGTLNIPVVSDPGAVFIGNTGTVTLGGSDTNGAAVGTLTGYTLIVLPKGLQVDVAAPGGALASTSGTENDTTITVQDGGTLSLDDDLTNTGEVVLNGGGPLGATLVANSPFQSDQLTGAGTILLSGSSDAIVSAGGTVEIDNRDNSIEGQGLLGAGSLSYNNEGGTVDANVAGASLTIDGGANGVVGNSSLMEATGGGTLTIDHTVGRYEVEPGIYDLAGSIVADGMGSTVLLNQATIVDGDLIARNGGTFALGGNVTLATINGVSLDTSLNVPSGQSLTLSGEIENNRTLTLGGAGGAATLNVSGFTQVYSSGSGAIVMANAGDTITGGASNLFNNGEFLIGQGQVGNGQLILSNSGTIDATGGTLTVNPGGGTITNNFLMESTGGTLLINGILHNQGEIDVKGGAVSTTGSLIGNGSMFLTSGTMKLGAGVASTETVYFSGAATLAVGDPAHMAATIDSFLPGDVIDFAGISADGFSYTDTSGSLALTSHGVRVASATIYNMASSGILGVVSDGHGGTLFGMIGGVVSSPGGVSITTPGGQSISLDALFSNPAITTTGTLHALTLNGSGNETVSFRLAVENLTVASGGLVLQGGEVNTDPLTVAASGNIMGYGTVTGTVSDAGTIDASDGTLTFTDAVTGGGALTVSAGSTALLQSGATLGSTTVNGGSLAAAGAFDDESLGLGGVMVENAGTFMAGTSKVAGAQGFDIAAITGDSGGAVVTGVNSLLSTSGTFLVGDAGTGSLAIENGATATTSADATISSSAAASGSSANVIGAGSNWRVTGTLNVGANGSGSMSVGAGATVSAGSLDTGNAAAAIGYVSVTDPGSHLVVTGDATVADEGTGVLSVLNGATFSAADLTIGSAGNSTGALMVSGAGSLIRLSGSLNIGTALGNGDLTVGPGATVVASVIDVQGGVVLEGGTLDPTIIIDNAGSTVSGSMGASVSDYIIIEGTFQATGAPTAGNPPFELQGTIVGGGTLTINGSSTVTGPGLLQLSGDGTMEVSGAVLNTATTTFTDNLSQASTYTVTDSVIDVSFLSSNEMLILDDIAGFGGTVTAYHASDLFAVTGGTLSGLGVSNGNTLTFSDSGAGARAGGIDSIIFSSGIDAGQFSIVNGNTVEVVACFAAGTLIETEDGPVAVESLSVGERVLTLDGPAEPIVWIGTRAIDCGLHPKPETVRPVRISASAFGAGAPGRDLWLSPDHAVFVDGVLIPIKYLINGCTIRQEPCDKVTYWHIELEQHNVLIAEGLAAESYLDTGGDAALAKDRRLVALHPDFSTRMWEAKGYAPLVVTGPVLRDVRTRLGRRIAMLTRGVEPRRNAALAA